MYDINNFTMRDMTDCGNALRTLGSGIKSMEETSNKIVRYLYDHLIDKTPDKRACALVRFFKTHPYGELSPDLQEFARGLFKVVMPEQTKCLVLLGTIGENQEWNSRDTSQGLTGVKSPLDCITPFINLYILCSHLY
ncbi:MAG: diguanylate cyclase/phosphodiesterase with FHA and GAF sensor [Candidatus Scalindua rubra]|uniref:Diguanylate cyclase/phosphodiesterase with FHA and GAF sensor n=1 Tax=Candidatus Scalindua rubra TaxID=1872076 RepID=A0A1E3X913_9BACT|nr:MAG: diguanylate cyclase/phosphodiesterase with FHA and GAF sensor [Candidatus Scalindua rubra]